MISGLSKVRADAEKRINYVRDLNAWSEAMLVATTLKEVFQSHRMPLPNR